MSSSTFINYTFLTSEQVATTCFNYELVNGVLEQDGIVTLSPSDLSSEKTRLALYMAVTFSIFEHPHGEHTIWIGAHKINKMGIWVYRGFRTRDEMIKYLNFILPLSSKFYTKHTVTPAQRELLTTHFSRYHSIYAILEFSKHLDPSTSSSSSSSVPLIEE